MTTQDRPATQTGREPLTPRELDCLKWMHAGYGPGDVATLLCLSLHTVRGHHKAIRRKYGVPAMWQALQLAEAEGLFDPPGGPDAAT